MVAYSKSPANTTILALSDKSQMKACQLQNRDRFEGQIIAAHRQKTSYPKYPLAFRQVIDKTLPAAKQCKYIFDK